MSDARGATDSASRPHSGWLLSKRDEARRCDTLPRGIEAPTWGSGRHWWWGTSMRAERRAAEAAAEGGLLPLGRGLLRNWTCGGVPVMPHSAQSISEFLVLWIKTHSLVIARGSLAPALGVSQLDGQLLVRCGLD